MTGQAKAKDALLYIAKQKVFRILGWIQAKLKILELISFNFVLIHTCIYLGYIYIKDENVKFSV